MNASTRSTAALAAVLLLGATAVGTGAFALASPFIGMAAAAHLGPSLGAAAIMVMVGMGLVSLAFAVGAAFAARAVHLGRGIGTPIGMVVGLMLVIGPTVAAVSGGWDPALSIAFLLGGGIIASLAAMLASRATPATAPMEAHGTA
ncbi:MAG TPA: hypothetical protein VHQ42_02460 [Candidatus Limnocylindria bacterium]|nr:hypothetical protein [Candidatus Limnocylindria bacterium]